MSIRGIRGATSVDENRSDAIVKATSELLTLMMKANHLSVDQLVSVTLTATADLDAVYPAQAARDLGWTNVPLLCLQEMNVQGSLSRCIRVMFLCHTSLSPDEIQHIYLGEARTLRPDLTEEEEQ